jgi:hypothetical protein
MSVLLPPALFVTAATASLWASPKDLDKAAVLPVYVAEFAVAAFANVLLWRIVARRRTPDGLLTDNWLPPA